MDVATINVDKTLDTSGLSCPMPLLRTKKALKEMSAGQVLKIIGTDPGSKKDIPEYGNKDGNEFLGMQDVDGGSTLFFIKKG